MVYLSNTLYQYNPVINYHSHHLLVFLKFLGIFEYHMVLIYYMVLNLISFINFNDTLLHYKRPELIDIKIEA